MTVSSADVPARPTRRERKKAALRGRILDAAVALFEERGVSEARVAEICARADVAEKTFFNHFPSKGHLLGEIAHEALDQVLADVESARKVPGTTRERIAHFFRAGAERSEAKGPVHREYLTELVHLGHEGGSEDTRRLHDAFGALVRDGRARGDVAADHDDEALTQLVLGAWYVLMFDWVHLEGFPLRERALSLARLVGDALAGPGAPDATEEDA